MTRAIFDAIQAFPGAGSWINPAGNSGSRKARTKGIFIAPAMIMYDYSFLNDNIGQSRHRPAQREIQKNA